MNVNDLKSFYNCKTYREMSKILNISDVAIWKWNKNGIPLKRQALFQIQTNGALKADLKQNVA
ncbi:Cro/CI family transcriptional regulator [Acinetobacter boissieri]|uniref:DNA-binding transcriptional regulator Cro n=1 Tax=Acinetobacter boissieri TaxID=1219383 RepID=A0A1G6I8U5_9GAMM|nr:Cro/CI family transcriptional regulator [Acinetobacter boissieri]SDC02871.1 DNA-binding transcriptional regulator Cro [Acinetobacter boissieri]